MSDNEGQAQVGGGAQQELPMVVHTQYVKDLSFENPNAPGILGSIKEPLKLDVKLDVGARQLQQQVYEVVLKMSVNATVQEQAGFVAELEYGGLVSVNPNLAQEQIEPALLIEGPRFLFPFARRVLAEATRDGGFPPVLINPIDFEQLYRRRKEQQAEAAAGAPAAAGDEAPSEA